VEQKRMNTVIEAVTERMIARPFVIQEFAAVVYCTEAMAAAVIGNVYAHHDIENLHKT
jgi:hypothetical protein